ncbi:MAG: D-glycero-beta-D-manno-heptose 1,7-bisphosphate 7-phosphatase [Deltaproteobacteria bacterium]|nr:D-glycero-beta-D-manno-heptose 1,7-bisphosphate 7-phosphatase [Deltaproteobacteria bacterium]
MKDKPAVFLDRDGTINIEKDYLIDPAEFEFIPGVPQALKRLQDAGFLLVVVTNQSGVARGFFSLSQVEQLHEYMSMLLADFGVTLAGIYICPHHPIAGTGEYRQECCCRKGQPGLLLQAAEDLAIDLQRSYVIGDKEADLQAGQAAGCQSFLVRTGYGEKFVETAFEYEAEVVADLPDAVFKILSQQL